MLYLVFLISHLPPKVAITEFNYDPVEGRPAYVELHNPGFEPVNLKNWRLQRRQTSSETNRVISNADLILNAGAFLVMVADAAPMIDAFGPGPYHAMARFPTFNRTTADEIRLFDASGVRIDSLQYVQTHWPRGTPHERRTVSVSAVFFENWSPGLSPGTSNLAKPPTNPLQIQAIAIREPDSVAIRFSRRLHPSLAGTQPDLLRFGGAIDGNIDIALIGIHDLFGNTFPDSSLRIRTRYSKPVRNDIILNELFLWGASPFIEIMNRKAHPFDLSGWMLNGRALPKTHLTAGFHIPIPLEPGGYAEFTSWPTLTKTSSGIGLRHPDGTLIDTIRYGSGWLFGAETVSLERIDPGRPSNDPKNWKAHPTSHTRKARNLNESIGAPFPNPDIIDIHSGKLRIRFPRFVIADKSIRIFVDGVRIETPNVDPMTADTWMIPLSSGDAVTIEADGIAIGPIPVSRQAEFGNLLFNEVMYHPQQDRYSDKPDQPQYLEIFNSSVYAISLEGIHLSDEPDKNGQTTSMHPVSSNRRWVASGNWIVLNPDTSASFGSTRLAKAFPGIEPASTLRFHRSTLSLTQAGKLVRLVAGNGTLIDSIRYSPSWHHPSRTEPKGLSLEKIDPTLASHLAFNWTSTAAPAGGTPGARNSVFRLPSASIDSAGISAHPNPFSDLQAIRIQADQPDYFVRLRIFDRYGRHIRTLADNEPLGNGRYWWWNGLRDDGQKPPIGAYMLHAELVGSRHAENRIWRHILVLAR